MASEIYVIPTAIMRGTGEEVRLRTCDQWLGRGGGHCLPTCSPWGHDGAGRVPPQHCPSLGHADHGHYLQLFDHIIDCIVDFQTKQNLMTQTLPLGFTFSFPCQQVGLDKVRGWLQHQGGGKDPRMWCEAAAWPLLLPLLQALLLTWTKGFTASGCVGQDVVQLLRDAAHRKQVGNVWWPVPVPRVHPAPRQCQPQQLSGCHLTTRVPISCLAACRAAGGGSAQRHGGNHDVLWL